MKRRLETMAVMFLESIKPLSFIGSQMALFFVGPFLSVFGDLGIDYIKFFDKRENVEKLLKRIEEEIKIREEEEQKAKEQTKRISAKFGFQLDFLPGFLLREDVSYNEIGSGLLGIARKELTGGEFLAISFRATDSSAIDFLNEISSYINRGDVRLALMLSQDVALTELESNRDRMKIKGHRASVTTYQWSNAKGQRGIVECYGFWCHKTKRVFILGTKTGPLAGHKNEKNQTTELRMMLGSFRCH
jgi:hypothetical protein